MVVVVFFLVLILMGLNENWVLGVSELTGRKGREKLVRRLGEVVSAGGTIHPGAPVAPGCQT